jgi:hypothetical protein
MSKKRGPLEIVWSSLALARLQEIRAFIALDIKASKPFLGTDDQIICRDPVRLGGDRDEFAVLLLVPKTL